MLVAACLCMGGKSWLSLKTHGVDELCLGMCKLMPIIVSSQGKASPLKTRPLHSLNMCSPHPAYNANSFFKQSYILTHGLHHHLYLFLTHRPQTFHFFSWSLHRYSPASDHICKGTDADLNINLSRHLPFETHKARCLSCFCHPLAPLVTWIAQGILCYCPSVS